MFARHAIAILSLLGPALAFGSAEVRSSLTRRQNGPVQVVISCSTGASGCACPTDLNGDAGVLINVFPGYQCAYAGGACTWSDDTGALQNKAQTNCPTSAPCGQDGCACPIDNNLDTGVLINEFKGYQCAYPGGACLWDNTGNLAPLVNTHQTNCVLNAPCTTDDEY